MTTEYVLLMALFAMLIAGVIFGDSGPRATFEKSAPRLAARLERNIATGTGWTSSKEIGGWNIPNAAPPQQN